MNTDPNTTEGPPCVHLAAVGCSGSKYESTDALPAKDRYKGSYWVNKRKYGETCADEWRIISAEHNLLAPDTEIHYYERTPADLEGTPVDTSACLPSGTSVNTKLDVWGLAVYNGLSEWLTDVRKQHTPETTILLDVLLGRAYRDPLETAGVFDALAVREPLTIRFPFQEVDAAQGGLFQQIGWMSSAVEAASTATE